MHMPAQVEAGNVTPVTALVQNLLMTALFEPFEALCSAANAEIAQVTMSALKHYRRHSDIVALAIWVWCIFAQHVWAHHSSEP